MFSKSLYIMVIFSCIAFLITFDMFFLNLFIPYIQQYYMVNIKVAIYPISTFALAYAITSLLASPLSDKYGRKKLLSFGLFIAIVGSTISALSIHNFTIFVLGRIISGFGLALVMPNIWAMIGYLMPPNKVQSSIKNLWISTSFSMFAGIPIALYINNLYQLDTIFKSMLFIYTILLFSILFIEDHDAEHESNISYLESFKRIYKNSEAKKTLLISFLWNYSLFGFFSIISLFYYRNFNLEGNSLIAIFIGVGLFNMFGNYISGKISMNNALLNAIIFSSIFVFLLSISPTITVAIIIHMIWSFFIGLGSAPLTGMIMLSSPKERSTIMGLNSFILNVSVFIGSTISAFILTVGDKNFWLIGILSFMCGLALLALYKQSKIIRMQNV